MHKTKQNSYKKLCQLSSFSFVFLALSSTISYADTQQKLSTSDTTTPTQIALDKKCKGIVTAAGKYGRSRQTNYGVFTNNSGFGPVGNYSWFAFGPNAPYAQARWAEDWSGLCNDPDKNKDWFNRLKYIPLNDSGNIWLSLNGAERFQYIFDSHAYMGYQNKKNSHRFLLRSIYGADLHVGSHVRAYVELINAVAGGIRQFGYQTGTQRSRLNLQQGFLELKNEMLGAKMGVIGGRQFFVDAPAAMQSPRELANIRQSWDGFRGYSIWKRFRIDLFDLWQTDEHNDQKVFTYGPNYNARLYGAYSSLALPSFYALGKKSQLFLDAFFIGYLFNGTTASIPTRQIAAMQKGSTRRDNIGGRISGNVGTINIDFTGVYQGGVFRPANNGNTRPVRAFLFSSLISHTFKNVGGSLTVGLKSDYSSGGNYKKTTGAVRNFAVPYFPTTDLDMTLYLTTSNSVSTGPLITYIPRPDILMVLHAPFIWRANTNDTVYGVGLTYPLRDNYSGGYIGSLPQFSLGYEIIPHLVISTSVAGFIGSSSIKNAGAKDSTFVLERLTFRF